MFITFSHTINSHILSFSTNEEESDLAPQDIIDRLAEQNMQIGESESDQFETPMKHGVVSGPGYCLSDVEEYTRTLLKLREQSLGVCHISDSESFDYQVMDDEAYLKMHSQVNKQLQQHLRDFKRKFMREKKRMPRQ